jgi:hypothetical protein
VRSFVDRLVQRSRGEALAAEPYRAPLLSSSFAPPDAVSASELMGQHPTADRLASKTHVQDQPQAPDDNSKPRVKPGQLSRRPETLNPVASPVRATVMQNDIHVTMDKTGVKTLPASGNHTTSPGLKHASPSAAQPEGEKPGQIDFHETHTYKVDPVASQLAESVEKALPLTRWHDWQLGQTGKTQKRGHQHLAQSKHRHASASSVDHAAIAVMQEEQTIDVNVHIGRIDIRATTSNPPPVQNRAAKTQTTMSLNDYIQGRTGGRR